MLLGELYIALAKVLDDCMVQYEGKGLASKTAYG
jgi:hypothetical protein